MSGGMQVHTQTNMYAVVSYAHEGFRVCLINNKQ